MKKISSPSYRERERERERESWSQGHQCQWEGRILLSGDHQYLASYAERQRQDVSHDCLDNVCCKYCSQDKETFHSLHSSANLEKQQSNQNLGFLTLALERKSQPGVDLISIIFCAPSLCRGRQTGLPPLTLRVGT